MKHLLAGLLCLSVFISTVGSSPSYAQKSPVQPGGQAEVRESINTVPTRPEGLNIYVNDYGQLLTPSDSALLRSKLQALDEAGVAQVSVLILPDTDRDLSEFAPMIMKTWDIQHYKKKDGLLILVNAHRTKNNLSGNRIFVATGYALEEKLPDALVGRVLDEKAIPAFEQGQFSKGVTDATLTLAQILAGDEELQSRYAQSDDDLDPGVIIFLLLLLFILFFNRKNRHRGGGFYGGGYGGGFGGFGSSGGGGFSGGFGGGGDAGGGGGAGR